MELVASAAPRGSTDPRQGWLTRFAVYGLLGWDVEVAFTGARAVVRRSDPDAAARTYLWMLPLYGAGGLMLEPLTRRLRSKKVRAPLRWLAYVAVIYGWELVSGAALRRFLGRCPWDYGNRGVNVAGLIRLDYLPYWLMLAAVIEPLQLVADAFCLSMPDPVTRDGAPSPDPSAPPEAPGPIQSQLPL
jgi:uncharacterized membrane protein